MCHDSTEYVKRCDRCQRYKPVPNLPAEIYHPQNSPWPFMQWAIDLVGPMPTAPAKKEMMIVATDYFTKWIEAEALSSTKEADITAFFKKYGIKQHLSTPRYPQGNGQAEASNKIILDCLKKRLEGAEGKWVDELPGVLWAYRTTKRRSTGETPFSLTYGTEAIIPPHVTVPSIGIEVGNIEQNSEQMRLNLDLLEGEREKAIVRVASYQQRLKSYYDKRAKIRQFQPSNLVLRKAFITAEQAIQLTPWKGRRFRDSGMPATSKDTIHNASSYLLSLQQMIEYCTFLKKRSNYCKFQNVPQQKTVAHKQCPSGDAGGQDSHTVAHKSVLRETQSDDQKRPSGDAAREEAS
ncbi:unnamed protein product [Prunus armeniaca]